MKIKVRKDFRETDGLIVGKRDNIEILLDESDMDEVRRKGFVTDTRYAGAKVTIIMPESFCNLLRKK